MSNAEAGRTLIADDDPNLIETYGYTIHPAIRATIALPVGKAPVV